MADIKSPAERSRNMAAIKGKNTRPEEIFGKWLFSEGFRYRKNVRYIIGHPDFYLRKYNVAVFVNGCFWHRHPGCRFAYMPKSHTEFWNLKFSRNIIRDDEVKILLKENGIRQIIIWECTIKKMKKNTEYRAAVMSAISDFIKSDSSYIAEF